MSSRKEGGDPEVCGRVKKGNGGMVRLVSCRGTGARASNLQWGGM